MPVVEAPDAPLHPEVDSALTLRQYLMIGLVPSSVPALVLIVALLCAIGLGELGTGTRSAFEQIAGGALLITYLKEIFPLRVLFGSLQLLSCLLDFPVNFLELSSI